MSFTYLFADTLILPKQNLRRIFEIMDNSRTGKKNLGTKTKQSWSSQRERGDMATDEGFQQKVKAEKEKYAQMSLDEKRKEYKCGPKFVTLNDIATWPEYALQKKKGTSCYLDSKCGFEVNDKLNRKISLFQGDITSLEIDAIVNAANESLMGGGGVDGAIHLAAGKFLKNECMTLGGCKTGDAKITSGYRLPAKHVIHTVGPIGENPEPLKSCYHTCLELLKKHSLKTVAFPCISTGIYGYPVLNASHVALKTIREWLEIESNAKNIQRIILCVFLSKDLEVYENLLPLYFPLGPRSHDENNGAYKIEEPDISESLNVSDHVSPQREVSPQRVQDKSTLKSQIPAFKHQVSAQAPKSQTSPKAGHTTKVSQALKSSAASTKTQPPAPTVSTKIQTSAPSVSIKTPASAPKSPKSEISRPQTSPPPSRSPPAPKPHSPPRPQSSSSNKSPQTKNKTGSAPVEMHAAPAPPQKAHDAPQKAHDAPQKAHDAPQKAHDTPQKAHDAPQKAHDTPQKAHDTPQRAHDTPQRAHDTPQRAHDTPQRAQDASQRAHDAPQKTHDAPQRAHDSPQRAHDSPQRAHDSPQRAHDSPQKAQDKPSSRTPSPKPAQKFQKKADTPRQKETTRSLKSQPPRKIPDPISFNAKCASRNDELKSDRPLKNKSRQVHAHRNNLVSKVNSHDCQVEASSDHEGPGSARKRRTPSPSETVPLKSAHF